MIIKRGPGLVFGGLFRTALTNERLFLMGITSLALSLASGWTTFEGMTNFTKSPVLCFLITFGVQGIMLVSAWMIGESLVSSGKKQHTRIWQNLGPRAMNFLKVAMIWLVFIFAMAISVFFSFDSLFSSIFSNDERQRAGEIRAQNQVGTVLADLKSRTEQRRFEAVDTLFASDGWKGYNARLDELGKVARSAPELVEQQLLTRMRGEQAEIARHQQSLAQAKGQSAALKSRQQQSEQSIARLRQDRPGLLAEVDQLRQSLREKQRLVDGKKAEAAKEARGIGQTGREGEGPKFRALKQEERRLIAERDVIKSQMDVAASRLEALDQRIAAQTRELALINGEVAKIEGEAAVAEKFIDAQEKRQSETIQQDLSATASIDSLDEARDKFRQQPSRAAFLAVQQNCTDLHNALSAVPKIAPQIRTISCEPGAATATVAARIFTLEAAQKAQAENCVIGTTRRSTRIDPLLTLGQKCIQNSGLPESDANELRAILSRVDLNRDDKAKNFVVTLNAFSDGNWLAYLALCLAISIDSLVFLSGLIGARTASYDNTGSPSDVMKYGLGMSSEILGFEPEDILTRKYFFRSIAGPSPLEGYLAIVDGENLTGDERLHVNKVLTIAGDKIRQDAMNPHIFHVDEKFYQNLARQVYLWDQFHRPKPAKPKKPQNPKKAARQKNKLPLPEISRMNFGKVVEGSITRKGESRAPSPAPAITPLKPANTNETKLTDDERDKQADQPLPEAELTAMRRPDKLLPVKEFTDNEISANALTAEADDTSPPATPEPRKSGQPVASLFLDRTGEPAVKNLQRQLGNVASKLGWSKNSKKTVNAPASQNNGGEDDE